MKLTLIYFLFFLINKVKTHIDRICGGKQAEKDQFPFFVQLLMIVNPYGQTYGCGGTLIKPQWVLTAAHCYPYPYEILNKFAKNNWIRSVMGTNNQFDKKGMWNFVSEVIKHPEHVTNVVNKTTGTISLIKNDIALVWLRKPYKLSEHIQIINLPDDMDSICNFGTIIGIGAISFTGRINEKVNYALVHIKDKESLITPVNPNTISESVFFTEVEWCTGHALQGDSGGPFICRNKSGFPIQYGICSAGFNSTVREKTIVVLYESVYSYKNYIYKTITEFRPKSYNLKLSSRNNYINLLIYNIIFYLLIN